MDPDNHVTIGDVELEYTYEDGQLTFVTEAGGMFLLVPVEEEPVEEAAAEEAAA